MRFLLALTAVAGCATTDAAPVGKTFSNEAYAQHIKDLRARLTKLGLGSLEIRIEDPFVVVGEGTAKQLERSAGTVRWAADILERDYFGKRPSIILDIFLFDTAATYERGVKKLTGEEPGTPYGFYSRTHRGLFMNIATGGGTLVHEIVHPYVEADFPSAPAWLNEGLGSLYEQSAERDGHIVGLTNWRLAGLQKAIAKDTVPTFKTLTSMDSETFYGEASGTNYSQSRYLLYYMQEKGLLRDFYKAFRAARSKDPTGYATLVKALGEKDMADFEDRWQAFVAKLRFP
ncbi:MAG: hypothetical protein M4D80_11625 [Myxococcota bacterium]|nr:hypothetical protein [Deltaproteobacteria bacterium]MDQ3335809.1 hypothetical protein [Myxococcota bacterium]